MTRAEAWAQEEGDEKCFVISSWELPHAFAAFAVTSAPTVVDVNKGKVVVHIEYPKVYDFFMTKAERAALPRGRKTRGRKKKGRR